MEICNNNEINQNQNNENKNPENQSFYNVMNQLNSQLVNLEINFKNFDFENVNFNNYLEFKTNLDLSNNELIKIWNIHSNKSKIMKCQHCKINNISIPNQLRNLTSRGNYNRKKNHCSTNYLPNGLFAFVSNEFKDHLFKYFNDCQKNLLLTQQSIDNYQKYVWNYLMTNENLKPFNFIGLVCYKCYNFELPKHDFCIQNNTIQHNIEISLEEKIKNEYLYILPFLIKKHKCIYYDKKSYCSKNCWNKEDINYEINNKNHLEILKNKLTNFEKFINLFICEKHLKRIQ